ncbi:hypothetical protein AB0J38_13240 [Streptomyces sp. NPDC050095]|uniref:hypothetical protein n=1 Tax=unclassified Streptomyces TaxID=2593676 RepID=UPI00343482C9
MEAAGDLGLLVEAVAAWREGLPLDVLAERFEFLELDEFASQRSELLSSDFHRKRWALLRRLYADEVLRRMFPTITHGAVRLRIAPMDATSRQILVSEETGERYEVKRVGVPGDVWTDVPTADLIAYLRTALTEE